MSRSLSAPPERLLELHARSPERYPALLQSAVRDEKLGRYDILFAFPQRVVHGIHDRPFLTALEQEFLKEKSATIASSLPFTGGWLVFLGYELASEIEPTLALPRATDPFTALALRVPAAVIYDHAVPALHLIAEEGQEELLREMRRDLFATSGLASLPAIRGAVREDSPEVFIEGVRRTQEWIRAGEVYQVNLSRGWSVDVGSSTTPVDLYRHLRASNPAPFAASLVVDDWAALSSSPERLFSIRKGAISTRPIAGTRARSRLNGADRAEKEWLVAHPKERAEHIMLVDLERNDLGRVCVPGTVEVDELMAVESYEHVHHLVSNVWGRLQEGITPANVIRAVFPGGTITGCPKIRCMQIIAELEGVGRGAYTGSMGYLNRDGSGDFNILIRTLTHRRSTGEVQFRAGAGIVADSDPERELEETRAKAKGLLRALGESD